MEPYLKHGRSTLSPFIFARDGSIGPRRSRPICSSQFPPTSGGLMKRQTHHMEITRVAHIVLCYVPTHTNSMASVIELKRSMIDPCLLCINSALRLPFEWIHRAEGISADLLFTVSPHLGGSHEKANTSYGNHTCGSYCTVLRTYIQIACPQF